MNTKRFLALSSTLAALLALPLSGTAEASSQFLAAQSQSGSTASQLVVRVRGLESRDGQVMVGLYDTAEGFESESEMMGRTVPVSGDVTNIEFKGLPVGDYALKIFHDEDADGQLDTNVLGIPSEPYGFSNNASDPFSAPEWDETKFSLPRGRMTQTVDLD